MPHSDTAPQVTDSTWPPPPTTTSETLTIEDVVVTRSPETLTVLNPRHKKLVLWIVGVNLVMMAILWLFTVWQSYDAYVQSVSNGASHRIIQWQRQTLWLQIGVATVICGLNCVYIAGLLWVPFAMISGRGVTTFLRTNKQFRQGASRLGAAGTVTSLTMRPTKDPLHRNYMLQFTMGKPRFFQKTRWMASLRQADKARRVAEIVADFLEVPVEDLSASAGREHRAGRRRGS